MMNIQESQAVLAPDDLPSSTTKTLSANGTASTTLPVSRERLLPSREEAESIARRGWELYEQKIGAQVEPLHIDKFISIDIDTEEYAVAEDPLVAAKVLRADKPDARLYGTRIGSKAMYKI